METLVHFTDSSHTLFLSGSAVLLVIVACLVAYSLPYWAEHAPKKLIHFLNLARHSDQGKEAALEASPPSVCKENEFPPDWFTSSSLYQLEKRAIFSKTWLHICHNSLFKKVGDYRTFSIAGFSFFIILGKDGRLRAFHNICRHRAYTVATKESGCSRALMCKYHGWTYVKLMGRMPTREMWEPHRVSHRVELSSFPSFLSKTLTDLSTHLLRYDTTGKLIKAPKFEDVPGFDKTQNGLYEIRTFIDSSGFIYANFDIYGSDGLTIRVGVPIRARLTLVESWNIDAKFNWKLAVPSGVFRVGSLVRRSNLPDLLRSAVRSLNPKSSSWPAEFELSPLTRLLRSPSGDLWLTIAIIPQSNTTCSIACSLYCSQLDLKADLPITAIKSDLNDSVQKLQLIFDEIKDEGTIADVRSQEPFLAEIRAHARLERLTKSEVYPASRLRETSQACKVADDLCKQLEIAAGDHSSQESKALAW